MGSVERRVPMVCSNVICLLVVSSLGLLFLVSLILSVASFECQKEPLAF